MKYFTLWEWAIISLPLLMILLIMAKPEPPKYIVHFLNIKTGFTAYGSPILEKAVDEYIAKARTKYADENFRFWKESWNAHSLVYTYKREGEVHVFGRDGVLQVVPEDLF